MEYTEADRQATRGRHLNTFLGQSNQIILKLRYNWRQNQCPNSVTKTISCTVNNTKED